MSVFIAIHEPAPPKRRMSFGFSVVSDTLGQGGSSARTLQALPLLGELAELSPQGKGIENAI